MPRVLEPAVELLEGVARLVEQPAHAPVHDARHLGPRVDAAEAEQRVRAHLRRLARLRHEPLAERDHDGVVLGQRAGEVPEPLAHHVGADGVGGLLHLVVGRLVLAGALAEAAEEPRAERGRRGGHREAAGDAARREGVGRDRLRLRALDLHVLEPEVEAQEHGPGVEGPLGDEVRACRGLARDSPEGARVRKARAFYELAADPEPVCGIPTPREAKRIDPGTAPRVERNDCACRRPRVTRRGSRPAPTDGETGFTREEEPCRPP